ncbi:putative ribonuclease H-like domain-containing protein [Tanacetum coccineum]|uniref:Ribonuclease H-like domain-containing protein n=1 Tax=Tanacetum coccineum TaxID=301880 RepID=A0ABQ5D630_9ASTR
MGLDDLYNNFKIVEQKVKKSTGAINDEKNLAFLTTSGASSTTNINTANPKVSMYHSKGNTAVLWCGFDWSDMAEEEIQANMALMAFSDSEVTNDKSCLQNYEALKKQYDDLLVKLDDTGFKASTYKRGLSILEGQILKYKESEVLFSEEIALLKRSVGHKEYLMGLLRTELEKVKEEKEGFEFKIAKPTPLDLSYSSLQEFKQPEVNEYGPRDLSVMPITGCDKESDNSKENTDDSLKQQQKTDSSLGILEEEPKKARENNDAPIIKDWVSDDEDDVEPIPKVEKKTVILCNKKSVVNLKHQLGGQLVWIHDPSFRFKDFDGGYVTFGGGANGGRITGKGTIKTDKLDFDDVYFVKELKFNLFSVSQMCDKKNYVLFTDSECLVLSPNFKLPDENQILLKIPRQDNMYSFDMKNIVPKDGLTCLVAKATSEESMLWHRRLGHVNFKNINKLVKENLVRDLPLKRFENGTKTCVACLKGKQHRASLKGKYWTTHLSYVEQEKEVMKLVLLVKEERRSAEKRSRQDKGKAIMIESEPKKKSKKELEQERLSFAEAIRLEEQMNEEQRAQIARDEEIARQWDEEERQRAMAEAKSTTKIDWNDPSVIRYHTQKMKPKTVAQARKNMIKYLKNQGNYKISDFKGMSYNEIRPIFEKMGRKKMWLLSKRENDKKSLKKIRSKRRNLFRMKKHKEEDKRWMEDAEKRRTQRIFRYNTKRRVFRGDGSSKNYKVLCEMLEDFDRRDVEELYRLVKKKYTIHMLTEKKYPLSQELLSKMLSKKLEVDHESSHAFELLRSIRYEKQGYIGAVMSSSTVTYTSYTDSEPWRFYGGSDEEPSDVGSPGVPYTDTDGLDVFGATPSLVYVPGPEPTHHSGLSAGLDHPPRTSYSPIHGFVLTLIRWRSERGQRRIILNYPADGRAVMNESLMVTMMIADDGDWSKYQEVSEDKDDEDEEEEHLASADSSAILVVDPVPSVGDTKAFETDNPTYAEAPLGYREARIRIRAASPPLLLPSTSHGTDIPEAEMLLWKRACFTTPAFGFEVGESSATAAARQLGPTLEPLRRRTPREATYARRAWTSSKDRSASIEAHVRTLEARVATLMAQTSSLQTQLTTTLRRS